MPKFSGTSKARLSTCDERLQIIMNRAIEIVDFSVLCGYRSAVEQDKLFEQGKSTVQYPHSKHNSFPSLAVDIAPYPIDWTDIVRFKNLAQVVKETAKYYAIPIEWGGDWKHFKDYPHFQLKEV